VVEIRDLRAGDIEHVAAHMRAADVAEVRAGNHEPLEALRHSVRVSARTWVAVVEGRPAAIFGVAPLGTVLDPRGAPWLLGTDDVPAKPRALVRLARVYTSEMLSAFPHLVNAVHTRNTAACTWLARVGFTLGATFDHPVTGEPFTIFEMQGGRHV
jgi:hypothetical protein